MEFLDPIFLSLTCALVLHASGSLFFVLATETWDDRWLFSYYPFTGTKCIMEDNGGCVNRLEISDHSLRSRRRESKVRSMGTCR